ncbi:hypothetical protein ABTZ03_22520 [Kitasatospora sp. NPDC096077]|uniref:hypothetical protein n=1 Tax=Kitasatospora sp. NPDC096077 TaxID=3155544 RepID=UPI0033338ABD
MRTSVITRIAKNDRAFSGRRRIAVLAATTVLAGGVQFIAADTGWACGDQRYDTPPVVAGPTVPTSAFLHSDPTSIAADGNWSEFGLTVANDSGADVARTTPSFGLASAGQGAPLRTKDLRVEVKQHGTWKALKLNAGCIGIDVDTDSLTQPMANHQTADFTFRVSLSPDAPKGLTSLNLVTDASNDKFTPESWDFRTVKVTHPRTAPAADTAGQQAPAGKPAPAKPAPAKAAQPAAEKTTAAPAAGAVPTAAPATTAPAGTPELAHTGASATNAFLATSSAVLLALGGGVLLAVRRLRRQR